MPSEALTTVGFEMLPDLFLTAGSGDTPAHVAVSGAQEGVSYYIGGTDWHSCYSRRQASQSSAGEAESEARAVWWRLLGGTLERSGHSMEVVARRLSETTSQTPCIPAVPRSAFSGTKGESARPTVQGATPDQNTAVERFLEGCPAVPSIRYVYIRREYDESVVLTAVVDEFSREVLRQVACLELEAVAHNPLVPVDVEVERLGERGDAALVHRADLGRQVYAAGT